MRTDDPTYLEMRAEQELELARRAKDARAVSAHYKLACRYLDMLYPDHSREGAGEEARDEASRRSSGGKPARH